MNAKKLICSAVIFCTAILIGIPVPTLATNISPIYQYNSTNTSNEFQAAVIDLDIPAESADDASAKDHPVVDNPPTNPDHYYICQPTNPTYDISCQIFQTDPWYSFGCETNPEFGPMCWTNPDFHFICQTDPFFDPLCTIPVEADDVPVGFDLRQNYPNPFNPVTTIEFSLDETAFTRLMVFNVSGQVVSTLIDQIMPYGTSSISFDASGLQSGLYFYSLESGDQRVMKKMILVK
jgi:hypothetical protein